MICAPALDLQQPREGLVDRERRVPRQCARSHLQSPAKLRQVLCHIDHCDGCSVHRMHLARAVPGAVRAQRRERKAAEDIRVEGIRRFRCTGGHGCGCQALRHLPQAERGGAALVSQRLTQVTKTRVGPLNDRARFA
eukprot:4581293-Prymnesium_polylepis.2